MRGLAHKKVSWMSSVKRISYSEMSPARSPDAVTENVSLLEGRPQKRFFSGRYRVYGADSLWSWLVAFANFLVNFLIVGLGRMSGILYVEFMIVFNIDRLTASVPFSIQQAARNLFGPVAGIMGQKYGIRCVTVLGGVIASLSASILYFQMNVTSITMLWGLLFGISAALTTTLNQVSIDQYFERNRATAGGFAFSGGCVGAFFFPVVLEALVHDYGLRGTFLVLGAVLLHVIPAAMILVEPPWKAKGNEETYKKNITRYGAVAVGEPAHAVTAASEEKGHQLEKAQKIRQQSCGIDFAVLQENSDIVFQLLTMEFSEESIRARINQNSGQRVDQMRLLNEVECVYSMVANPEAEHGDIPPSHAALDSENTRKESVSGEEKDEEINKKDLSLKSYDEVPRRVYIQTKLKELYGMRGTKIISHFHYPDQPRASRILIELRKLYEKLTDEPIGQTIYNKAQYFVPSAPKEMKETPGKVKSIKHSNSFCTHIQTAVKLHANPLFLLICICRGVFMLTFIPVVTIIVDFAMDQGLQRSDGKYAIAALSLGDFLGRLCLGWVTDRGCLTLTRYMLVVMILLGGNTAALPFLHSKTSILLAILIFGILQGSLYVRHPVLISQYMKSHEQSVGMGFINFLSGILGFALPAFIGYFRDTLGSYNRMFYINGIVCAAVGLLWGLEPLLLRGSSCENPEKSRKRQRS